MTVVVIGRGRVGRALHDALVAAGVESKLVSGRAPRDRDVRDATQVILAVPDSAIASTAERIARSLPRRAVVIHCAGARDATELEPCRRAGAHVGVMHPMVSFPLPGRAPQLAGTTFVCAGDRAALAAMRKLGRAMSARVVTAPVHGPAYHAAAALAANGTATLATHAVSILVHLGMRRRDAQRTIGGLLRTVADNVERIGVPDSLTGPIRRGDADTVRAHRDALRAIDRPALAAYDAIAPAILAVARTAGLPARLARNVTRALRG